MGGAPSDNQPLGGCSHGAYVSMVSEGTSSDTHPSSVLPGGSDANNMTRNDEMWYGNAPPVVEEPPNENVAI